MNSIHSARLLLLWNNRRMNRRAPMVLEHDPAALDAAALTGAQESFCAAVAEYRNLGLAYRMAYPTSHRISGHVVHLMALELQSDPRIRARIEELRAAREIALTVTRKEIFDDLHDIASADALSVVSVRRVNCRYCSNGAYAWKTPREYAAECDRQRAVLDCSGGFEFDINAAPNPDCRECGGEGEPVVHVADMASLGPKERKLVKSIEQTERGLIKVTFHDQVAAKRSIGEALELFKATQMHMPLHAPAAPIAPLVPAMSEEEAARLYLEEIKG